MVAQDLESIVRRFELRWYADGSAEIDGLVDEDHPEFERVLVELVRCEMEFLWAKDQQKPITEYLDRYPQLSSGPALQAIAFEDYRLSHIHGRPIPASEFERLFAIDISAWPAWQEADPDRPHQSHASRHGQHNEPLELPSIGDTIGDFELIGELGRGAFAHVYLARQGALANRFVALKVSAESTQEPQYLAELQHSHIVPIYSFHRVQGLQAICMPFLGVATLDDLLRVAKSDACPQRNGKALISTVVANRRSTMIETISGRHGQSAKRMLDGQCPSAHRLAAFENLGFEQTALQLVKGVADGLAYAHEHGLVHGDLKPKNVLISDDGQPLLLDFNLSRPIDDLHDKQVAGGTLPYMSPEQLDSWESGRPVDGRSDIYSLGAILYELLTDRLPCAVRGDEPSEIVAHLREQQRDGPPDLRHCNPHLTRSVQSIVQKCLEQNPADRYQSSRQLHEDLSRHLDHLPLRFAPNRSARERIQKWYRRHPRLTSNGSIVSACVVILLLTALAVTNRVTRLLRLEAADQSRQIVSMLDAAKFPLMFLDRGPDQLKAYREHADALLSKHVVRRNRETELRLQRILPALRVEEMRTAAELSYWIASALLHESMAVSSVSARRQLLEMALDRNQQAGRYLESVNLPRAFFMQQSELYSRLDLPDRAAAARAKAEAAPDWDAVDRTLTAMQTWRSGDVERALKFLREATSQSPDNYTAWLTMGNIYLGQRDFREAIAAYTICISLDASVAAAYYYRGQANLGLARYQEAHDDLTTVQRLEPGDPATFFSRHLAQLGLGRLEAAEQDLTRTLDLGATQTRVYFVRSRIRRSLGNEKGAADDIRRGLSEAPADPLSWVSHGLAMIQEDPRAALASFDRALQLNPTLTEAWQNKAAVYSEFLGENEAAVDALTKIIELDAKDATAIATRGVLYGRQGDRSAALADADRSLRLRTDADTLYRVAGIYALTSRVHPADSDRAIALLAEAIWLNPGVVATHLQDDPDIKAIENDPAYVELTRLLERIESRRGLN